jgi:hypothetical protein
MVVGEKGGQLLENVVPGAGVQLGDDEKDILAYEVSDSHIGDSLVTDTVPGWLALGLRSREIKARRRISRVKRIETRLRTS